ncbi:TOMM precursor leader peptide-binding protein [Cellulomonas sp. P22]|uniref:TOMM precursor leader peptide-binding protein n=1 Tax=Cellulomonas sp. P22 TaxID=3373189 RepID=UPI0037982855
MTVPPEERPRAATLVPVGVTRDSLVRLADGTGVALRPGSARLVHGSRRETLTSLPARALLGALDPDGAPRPLHAVLADALADHASTSPGGATRTIPAAGWMAALASLVARGTVLVDPPGAGLVAPHPLRGFLGAPTTSLAAGPMPVEVDVVGATRGATGAAVRAALAACGFAAEIGAATSTAPPAARVVLTADLTSGAARAAYDSALAAGVPVLPVGLGQRTVLLAPVLGPQGTCPACLVRSLAPGAEHDPPDDVPLGWSPAVEAVAGGLVAGCLAQHLSGRPAPAWELVALDVADASTRRHRLIRFTTCGRCGRPPAPRRTATAPTPVRAADGYRSTGAAEFVARVDALVDPLTGVVTEVSDAEQVAGGWVVRARHRVRTGAGWTTMPALGRGPDPLAARASALGEAVERYSVSWHGDEVHRTATLASLGHDGLDPAEWLLFAPGQVSESGPVPRRLDPDEVVDLLPLTSITSGRTRWAPASTLLFGHPGPHDVGTPDSNGCAAAATWSEAVLHGLLELVERDAASLWWYPRAHRPAVDPQVLDARTRAATDARLQAVGRRWWLLDLTHDLGVPVVAAVSARTAPEGSGEGEAVVLGLGAHLDVARAARRALGELDQMLALGPDTDPDAHPPVAREFWATARTSTHSYLHPDPDAVRCPARVAPSGDAATDVRALVDVLAAHRVEVLVHDASRPETGVPVARVLAPGLRHLDRRLAPGRLHDVPARLGWVEPGPRELNPVWLFV